ncbi:hypothetical protein [Kitasatospora mediocidica]|uniref:hypothetical protein n=1 Tax=Kitasatospora mediocidica TaxID=58352 RepID=UPI00055A9A56|nr:hypothetical protein [Kitasatospora mediocidica]
MSTQHERIQDTVVLLGATGVTGTPAEMKAWAEEAMADPETWRRLNEDLHRGYGATLDAAA